MLRPAVFIAMTAVAFAIAGKRAWDLFSMVRTGEHNPERFRDIPRRIGYELQKVIGQKKLLQWAGPGLAHAFTFWGFLVIQVALIESIGEFFDPHFQLPIIGDHAWLGFVFDFFIAAVTISVFAFTIIRIKNDPGRMGRRSRFFASHMDAAYLVLLMILGVVGTLLFINAGRHALGRLPYAEGAFLSTRVGEWMATTLPESTIEVVELGSLVGHVAIVYGFLILVLYSKHLHIFTSPLNVLFAKQPIALGRLRPLHIDIETMDEETTVGVGSVEEFEWKHLLDSLTCTECGRCQSVCPAWNTDKELNPKLLVMNIRDQMLEKGPIITGRVSEEEATGTAKEAAERSLVPDVITEDVLWACVTCGACVYECPVDIEHVDMIMDMRRHQVMMESKFPREAMGMLQNIESVQNPWGVAGSSRMDWAKGMEDEVRVLDAGQPIPDDVEYLFYVGCAGASDDRAMKTTRAVAQLLNEAGVSWAVLGPGESCNGDPARRIGNEFLFQEIAQANVEQFNEMGVRKIITQCPHCFNTMGKEYPDYGGNYEVLHHAELFAQLVREGKLSPKTPLDLDVTYHDPCYLARHDDVMDDPRHVVRATGSRSSEMHRCRKGTFCCGAGGARFFMEETEGKRINLERMEEALDTDPNVVGTACPFCLVMLDDGVKDLQMQGQGEGVEVMDVASLLQRSMMDGQPAVSGNGHGPGNGDGSSGEEQPADEGSTSSD